MLICSSKFWALWKIERVPTNSTLRLSLFTFHGLIAIEHVGDTVLTISKDAIIDHPTLENLLLRLVQEHFQVVFTDLS